MKKIIVAMVISVLGIGLLAGCGGGEQTINVITREEGSGTRGAFIELFGIEEKVDGQKVDHTSEEATVATSTNIVLTTVAGDENAIGYVSLGSLNDSVKAVKIEGAEATVEAVKAGSYTVTRPFLIATKGAPNAITQDFIDFILSTDGQAIVNDNSYIPAVASPTAYSDTKPSGTINISGSSSVSPLMQKLKEAYEAINTNGHVNLNTNDSTTGLNDVAGGIADIGMASRDLSDTEAQTLTDVTIAIDGIAVVVNKDNSLDNLTKDQVKDIYTGTTTTWNEVQ